jgi:hypothetical protein
MDGKEAAELVTEEGGSVSENDTQFNPGEEYLSDDNPEGEESKKGILGRLFNTEPSKPLTQIEDPYNPDIGGANRIFRGIQKLGDVEGLPAIADLLIGTFELVQQQGSEQTDEHTDEQTTGTDPQTGAVATGEDLE